MPTARTNKQRHRVKTVRARKEKLRKRLERVVDPKPEELKEMDKAIQLDDLKDLATVSIARPENCKKEALSLRALDSNTRNLALQTLITVNGKPLPCLGFRVMDDGVLRLEVHPEYFQFA